MIFGAHNWYHNGGSISGLDTDAAGLPIYGEYPVKITNRGVVIINLHEHLAVGDKLRLMATLNDGLKAEYASGFSFATTQISDSFRIHEQPEFFQGVKRILPTIKSIYLDMNWGGDRNWSTVNTPVDYILEQNNNVGDEIVKILKPTDNDRRELERNQAILEPSLAKMVNDALYGIKPALALSPEHYAAQQLSNARRQARLRPFPTDVQKLG